MRKRYQISNIAENQPIVAQCAGCNRIEGDVCRSYYSPGAYWRRGICPLASHVKYTDPKEAIKQRIGQQKQSKKKKKKA